MSDTDMTPDDPRATIGSLSRAVRQRMQSLGQAGVSRFPIPGEPPAARPTPEVPVPADDAAPTAPTATPAEPVAAPGTVDKRAELEAVADEVARCTRCKLLAQSRTHTVPGAGNPDARLVFVGEAPGYEEDRQGVPFVGKAGQLLTRIIEACKLTRDDVFICNILKCRPPQNRNPGPAETANCIGYLHRQLAIIRPALVCALGAVAAHALLETTASLGSLRGRFHDYRGIRVAVTYHPAYLLRYPEHKRKTWDDLKRVMRELGVEL